VNSVFGNLGTVGLALALTVLLLVGIPGGGKLKPLGWWWTLLFSMLAGSAYKAAGGIFKVVPDLVGSLIGQINTLMPGVTMPALALTTLIVLLFKKLTTRQVALIGISFWYIAAGAGGTWSYLSDSIANLGTNLA
jgi:hypothetical protein